MSGALTNKEQSRPMHFGRALFILLKQPPLKPLLFVMQSEVYNRRDGTEISVGQIACMDGFVH